MTGNNAWAVRNLFETASKINKKGVKCVTLKDYL